jgi:hypothetical protein
MSDTKSAIDVVRESLKVDGDSVTFRTRTGRGSGCGVTIPVSQLDEVMRLITEQYNAYKNRNTQQ